MNAGTLTIKTIKKMRFMFVGTLKKNQLWNKI